MRILKTMLAPFPAGLFVRVQAWLEHLFPADSAEFLRSTCDDRAPGRTFPARWLGPGPSPTLLPFEDMEIPVPQNYRAYLTAQYDDYMTPRP